MTSSEEDIPALSNPMPTPYPNQESTRELTYDKALDPDIYRDGKVGFPEETRQNNTTTTIGLEDTLPDDVLAEIRRNALENLEYNDYTNIDKNLDEDIKKIPLQNYVVVSFAGPKFKAKTDINGMRIMGAFNTEDEAIEYISEIQESKENIFDTGIVEMYKWVPSVPYLEQVTQEQVDDFLNNVIIKYKIEREEARLTFEYRKNRLMQNKDRFVEKNPKDSKDSYTVRDVPDSTDVPDVSEIVEQEPRNSTHARLIEKLKKRREEIRKTMTSKEHESKEQKVRVPKRKLAPSSLKVDGQQYVLISYVGNTGTNSRVAMKIRGVFDSYEECDNYCKELYEFDDTYDILIADMYKWLPCDPEVSKIENQVHSNEKLNQLIYTAEEEGTVSKKAQNALDIGADYRETVRENPGIPLDQLEKNIVREKNPIL